MFDRKIYSQLQEWKRKSQGGTAVLIEGARRVGKSTVAEAFAQREYDDYLLLDFSIESADVRRNFDENIGDLDAFFRNLFLLKGKSLPKGRSAIILDEVQLFPKARQAIKQLVKDGRYEYIETGSLISIKRNVKDILIPSEEQKIRMFPMDFEEFCWARGDSVTVPAIREAFERKRPLGDAVHRKIMRTFREYMAVGGMPQAVAEFVGGADWEEVDFAKRAILSLYEEDLHKQDGEERLRATAVFNSIPAQLSHRKGHFRFATVNTSERYETLSPSIEFLAESMIVNRCVGVSAPEVALELYEDPSDIKMYMGDTGLLVTHALRSGQAGESIYKALVIDRLGLNQGVFMENAVAQMLVANGHALHFHEFDYEAAEGEAAKSYELDFLIVRGRRICPVEVKSSSYKAHKSLDVFFGKYDVKAPERYVLYTKDLQLGSGVAYLPLYMAICL